MVDKTDISIENGIIDLSEDIEELTEKEMVKYLVQRVEVLEDTIAHMKIICDWMYILYVKPYIGTTKATKSKGNAIWETKEEIKKN